MSGSQLSKEFFELVKAIGEAKTKQEEDRIIQYEVGMLKKKLADRSFMEQEKKVREFIIRLIYVEMLGHDASFGYFKAIEMVASSNLMSKRVGYLCASLCFSPTHELRMMLISRLQKDMQSSNVLEVTTACIACCKLMTEDMIPAVLPIVLNLMKHDQEIVRKKAVMVMHRFNQVSPTSVGGMGEKFRRVLCDKDPSVMGASLHVLYDLAVADPLSFKDLVPSFVSILKQITEHRLPREFDYHRIPAPWIQMQLLRLLAVLGKADAAASEGMYEVILDCMRRADIGISVGYAIIYECVRTVTTIYPNAMLLDAAAASIARFISSDNHNLKYLGVTGLAAIVKEHPKYAVEHQMTVIDCLQDPDETLQRKTLDLLYGMTNPVNVEVITERMLDFLRNAVDTFLRSDLVSRITSMAERFAPSNEWFISTMTEVFELGGDLVRAETANNLMRLISEGTGEDEDQDAELRQFAVETYLKLLSKPSLPDTLLQTMFWVLGEYGYVAQSASLDSITTRVCEMANNPTMSPASRGYAVTAALKLTAQLGRLLPAANHLVTRYAFSKFTEVSQRCIEFKNLTLNSSVPASTMVDVLPVDASSEDIDVDEYLGFLDGYVQSSIAAGGRTYAPPADVEESTSSSRRNDGAAGLRFEAYERPEEPTVPISTLTEMNLESFGTSTNETATGGNEPASAPAPTPANSGLNLGGIKAVWGAAGYAGHLQETSAPAPASGPTPAPGTPTQDGPVTLSAPPEQILKRPWDFTAAETAAAAAMLAAASANPPAPAPAPSPAPASPTPASHPRRAGHEIVDNKPRELTEKEKMANALFAGLGAGGGGGGGSRRGMRSSATEPAHAPAPSTSTPTSNVDLFSGMSVPAAATPPTAPQRSGGDDLLGLGGSSTSVTPNVAHALMEAYGTGPSTSDPFGSSGIVAPVATRPAPAPAPMDDDPFAAIGGGSSSSSEVPTIASCTVPPLLRMAGSGLALSAVPKEFGTVGCLKVGGYALIKDNTFAVVIFVVAADGALANVTVQVTPPSFMSVSTIQSDPTGMAQGKSVFSVPAIPASKVACFIVDLVLASGPTPANVGFQVTATGSLQVSFSVPVTVMDTVRPSRITTDQFGAQWGPHSCEKKAAVTIPGLSGLPDLTTRLTQLNLHTVQTLPASHEVIAAGVLMGTTEQCLVHAQIVGTAVNIKVRSKIDSFSTTMLQAIGRGLVG